jgi:phosphoglucomutase
LNSGYLKLTSSNLKEPKEIWTEIHNGIYTLRTDVDRYKPVVWLTDKNSPEGLGLDYNPFGGGRVNFSKKIIRISITKEDTYKYWLSWVKKNNIDKSWMRSLINGMDYRSWYISEKEILLADIELIENLNTSEIIFDNRVTGGE